MKNILKQKIEHFLVIFTLVVLQGAMHAQPNLIQYVNPFIGTGGHGHTFPGAVMPFGMVQLSPDTRKDGSWDGCSGYHYSDSVIYGFSHTHLSGTGCSDWGDILLMPSTTTFLQQNKSSASKFSHRREKAGAGFYEVTMHNGVKAELTVTQRVGIHRYTYPQLGTKQLILDCTHRDKTQDYLAILLDSVTVAGYRVSEGWAKNQIVYFVLKTSAPIKSSIGLRKPPDLTLSIYNGGIETKTLSFAASKEPLIVKVAISPVSITGASLNLNAEATHWNFDQYKRNAQAAWNEQLKKILVNDIDKNKLSVFYTALYHCCIHPSLSMDVDNNYRGRDGSIHTANGYTNYTVFSLWDTYRALHPLFTVIERKRTNDFINSFLNQYRQSGRLPVWELSSNETDCMIGFHSVSVIADAMLKGIKNYDTLAIYEAMKAAADYSLFSIPTFNKNGFLQCDDEHESVSRSLEYGYDNWCIAQVAHSLGNKKEEEMYLWRSLSYRNFFDVQTGHMRPRSNGGWLSPFYPNEINNHFTEGNSWHYSFYAPHDISGLIELHGGDEKFGKKLDEMFSADKATRGRSQVDVTGLIGQYAHGNEPSHHMIYLYNYVGRPQETIKRVKQVCSEFYKNSSNGLIGNEDCGQMSAWYVFSAMGFYPVCPGSTQYVLGVPAFSNISVSSGNGKVFSIKANPNSDKPVSGISLNNVGKKTSFIDHSDIMAGSLLVFLNENSTNINTSYGKAIANRPYSAVRGIRYHPAPIIRAESKVFKNNLEIAIESINEPTQVNTFYTTNGGNIKMDSPVYSAPIKTDSTLKLKIQSISNESRGAITEGHFYKLKNDYEVNIASTLNPQYMAEGAQTLVDGIEGAINWRKGNWLGCQGQDFICTVDFKKQKTVNYLALRCLQDTRSWIVYPQSVNFYGSNDGVNFTLIDTVHNSVQADDYTEQIKLFELKSAHHAEYRYIKVIAKNYGKLPSWHAGAGDEAFVFTDELEIR